MTAEVLRAGAMETDVPAADGSLFEALYRVRAPDHGLAEHLRELGVDVAHRAPKYRATQWLHALEVYRVALFPHEAAADGNRKLGRALAEAYGKTLSGQLLSVTLQMLSPHQLLRRWPRFVRMGRTDVTLTVTETGPRSATIASFDPVGVPMEINYGLLEFCFERMRERAAFEVLPSSGTGEILVHCSW